MADLSETYAAALGILSAATQKMKSQRGSRFPRASAGGGGGSRRSMTGLYKPAPKSTGGGSRAAPRRRLAEAAYGAWKSKKKKEKTEKQDMPNWMVAGPTIRKK